jgi:ankyrin repeat protein
MDTWQKVKQLLCNRSTPRQFETALRDLEPGEIDRHDEDDGNTLLHLACLIGALMSVKILVDFGASLEVKNILGQTPLHLSPCFRGDDNVATLLLYRGADLEAQCDRGRTPLSYTVGLENEACVRLFINRGCKLVTRDKEGCNPVYVGISYSYNPLKVVCESSGRFPDQAYFMKDNGGRTASQQVEALIESTLAGYRESNFGDDAAHRNFPYVKKLTENRDYLLKREREAIMKVLVSPLTIPRLAGPQCSIRILPMDIVQELDKFLF